MGKDEDPDFFKDWPIIRFCVKTVAVFIAILTGIQMLGEWWVPAKQLREHVLSQVYILPCTFIIFFALHLTLECYLHLKKQELEKLRPKQRWKTVAQKRRAETRQSGKR